VLLPGRGAGATLTGVNEVVPWSARAWAAVAPVPRRAGRTVARWWGRFTDLGVGALLLTVGVLVATGIAVAVVDGRGGPEPVACQEAAPYVDTITRMERTEALNRAQVVTLHEASAQLATLAATARGDDRKAISDAAGVAGDARAGQPLETSRTALEFEAACSTGPHTGGLRER
jgi:hypothetical protein